MLLRCGCDCVYCYLGCLCLLAGYDSFDFWVFGFDVVNSVVTCMML